MKKLLRRLANWLNRFTAPTQEELVRMLVLNTASLALRKDECVELAPISGTCGSFKLSGNSFPSINYIVFEKKLMEFIHVRVEVSRPDRLAFISSITSTTAPERHGEEVPTTDKYKEPFNKLINHLFNYFPFPMEGVRKLTIGAQGGVKNELTQEVQGKALPDQSVHSA